MRAPFDAVLGGIFQSFLNFLNDIKQAALNTFNFIKGLVPGSTKETQKAIDELAPSDRVKQGFDDLKEKIDELKPDPSTMEAMQSILDGHLANAAAATNQTEKQRHLGLAAA